MHPTAPPAVPPGPRPLRPARRRTAALASGTGAALAATLLLGAGPAAAAPAPPQAPPTAGLPGTGELSALATARPATLADAQEQFLARTPARYAEQELTWAPCPPEWLQLPQFAELLECAAVQVPRDWGNPEEGEPLRVAVSRLPRPGGERPERTVITNPGGPGGSGLELAAAIGAVPGLEGTEVIGLDVRGTGASTPLRCGEEAALAQASAPDYRDRSPEALLATADAVAATAAACADDPLVDVVTTEQTVADIDLVRHVLDRGTIDWVGYSAGTWLGAQYATYFPARTGRFVLDSALDVTAPWQTAFAENQAPAFQRRFEQDFAPWAAQHARLFHLGTTPEEVGATYERLRADLAARPLQVPVLGLSVDGVLLDALVLQSMYGKANFETLAWTLRGLRTVADLAAWGDRAGAERATAELTRRLQELLPPELLSTEESGSEQGGVPPHPYTLQATFLATTCNDTAWTRGSAFWEELSERQGSAHPLRGWATLQQPCGYWDRPALTLPRPDGRDLPPLLVVQSENDPATPVEGARVTHEALPSSRMITVTGEGDHGVYGTIGNACVDDVVTTFLVTGEAPAGDVTCEGTGIPDPGLARLLDTPLRDLLPGA
ncbi:alpha/beta hydrolase [Kineococcus terrestris]|uniref:alpha/beta hydrolase n=1 Tax=Kineococcus terrestris TaxID=2044856 RepID=UPI0034DB05D8